MDTLYYFAAGMFIGFVAKVAADWLDMEWKVFKAISADAAKRKAVRDKWVSNSVPKKDEDQDDKS